MLWNNDFFLLNNTLYQIFDLLTLTVLPETSSTQMLTHFSLDIESFIKHFIQFHTEQCEGVMVLDLFEREAVWSHVLYA